MTTAVVTAVASIIGATAAVGGTVAGVVEGRKARKAAQRQQASLLSQPGDRVEEARKRILRRRGREETILTSPLGAPGPVAGTQTTLLGGSTATV